MTASTVPDLITSLLRNDPVRPLVTFYDDSTGERVELSVKTFENWVAKTANLLQGELSADPGEHVALWLPAHWQTAVWVCAAAACGVVVSTDPRVQTPVDVAVCGPESLCQAFSASISSPRAARRRKTPCPSGHWSTWVRPRLRATMSVPHWGQASASMPRRYRPPPTPARAAGRSSPDRAGSG